MNYTKFKRMFDFVFAFVGIIALSPIFILIIIFIKIDSKGPIFFRQKRVGKKKSHFTILKFRTMRAEAPKETATHLLENPDLWITRTGRFLRKTSLDELPQLFNILTGKMSFVGPRPALWNQFDLIEEREKYSANDVLPGITGWAQVNGRDELLIPEKARLDGIYVKKMSFRVDLYLLYRTIIIVAKKDGVVEGGTGTIEKKK